MSAFIVEDETINKVVAYLKNCREKKELWIFYPVQDIGYDLSAPLCAKRLAEDMFTLNCRSIDERYGENEHEEMSGGKMFSYQDIAPTQYNRIQTLKALSCFLYQSCEGECDKDPLYLALESIRGKLAYSILSDLPQYNSAKWE